MSPTLSKQTEGIQKPFKRTKGWPPKRRRAQADRIRQQKPWLKSTGPRTAEGKRKTRFNAITHGNRRYVWRELRHVLKLHRRSLKELAEYYFYKNHPCRLKTDYYNRHPRLAMRSRATCGDPAQKPVRQRRTQNELIAMMLIKTMTEKINAASRATPEIIQPPGHYHFALAPAQVPSRVS